MEDEEKSDRCFRWRQGETVNPEEQVNLQEPEVATPVAAAPEVKKGT